ncbi:MAG: SIS domain-containing protein, partial [Rhodothermales bacterium]|nr:SIS domain-containing protein [Rhodothermales bacterium]
LIPDKIKSMLDSNEDLLELAQGYRYASNFLYLGRGFNFPVALEGALKLKEISYIHAEGYPAAEMKHGPIALIDRFMPVVFIAMKDSSYDKVVSNIEEVVARDGSVIVVTDSDDPELDRLCERVIRIPETREFLSPLLTVVPLQLLSYHVAVLRGCDVDQPRNLAKSVTVE